MKFREKGIPVSTGETPESRRQRITAWEKSTEAAAEELRVQTDPVLVERKARRLAKLDSLELAGRRKWPDFPGFKITVNESSPEELKDRISHLASQSPEERAMILENEMREMEQVLERQGFIVRTKRGENGIREITLYEKSEKAGNPKLVSVIIREYVDMEDPRRSWIIGNLSLDGKINDVSSLHYTLRAYGPDGFRRLLMVAEEINYRFKLQATVQLSSEQPKRGVILGKTAEDDVG